MQVVETVRVTPNGRVVALADIAKKMTKIIDGTYGDTLISAKPGQKLISLAKQQACAIGRWQEQLSIPP